MKNTPGPRAPPDRRRPNLKMTALSYSWKDSLQCVRKYQVKYCFLFSPNKKLKKEMQGKQWKFGFLLRPLLGRESNSWIKLNKSTERSCQYHCYLNNLHHKAEAGRESCNNQDHRAEGEDVREDAGPLLAGGIITLIDAISESVTNINGFHYSVEAA